MKLKKLFLLTVVLLVFSCGFKFSNDNDFEYFYRMYLNKDFFILKTQVNQQKENLEQWQSYVITTFVASAFGKYQISNNLINELFEKHFNEVPDSIMARIYLTKSNNAVKLGNYKDAYEASKVIVEKYSNSISEDMLTDIKNSMKIWQAVKDVPKMNLTNRKGVKIQMKTDMAGLYNVPVRVNKEVFEFVFDTGANFSSITQSNAKKSGLEVYDSEFDVGTSTGDKVKAKVGIAKIFQLGELIFENVLFIILPDEALEFGGGIYKIAGIVGFPVMEELKEIRINKMYELIVPVDKIPVSAPNLFYDEFTPVVQGFIDSDTLNFIFDSGAKNSSLYEKYYSKYNDFIKNNFKEEKSKVQGAGSEKIIRTYNIGNKELRVYNKSAILKNLYVYADILDDDNNYFSGKIGRDYLEQFDMIIMNFEYPALVLK